jgi:DNA-binding response OmpR family regulator
VHDGGQPKLAQMTELEAKRAACKVQLAGHDEQRSQRHAVQRHRIPATERIQVDLVAMVGRDHRKTGEAALGGMKRLRLIVEGARPMPHGHGPQARDVLHLGHLELRFDIHRAIWAGSPIDLTLTEFKIVALLVQRTGEDVSYREIYDVVHGKGFSAGYGDEGYRPDVRTFITRIRMKFHDVDPEFQHIYNCAGFGYRWCAE